MNNKANEGDFDKDPVFQGVSLKKFILLIASVFKIKGVVITPDELAKEIAGRPYEPRVGCASFYAIPTPQNEWGWMYKTVSGCQLIWLPDCMVFTRGLRKSQNFLDLVKEVLGEIVERVEPAWLNVVLTLVIVVNRPRVSEEGYEPDVVDNKVFFTAITHKPFEVCDESVLLGLKGIKAIEDAGYI